MRNEEKKIFMVKRSVYKQTKKGWGEIWTEIVGLNWNRKEIIW